VLNGYGKKALIRDAVKAMEILKENDVRVTGGFILGALNETKDMMRETINFAKRLNPSTAQFSILTPYPGTKLYERVKDRRPTIKLNHVSPEQLRRLLIMAYFSFYGRPGKVVENMPYLYKMFPSVLKPLASKLFFEKAKPVFRFPFVC
jgi:anaerobic magnesium-protoporphyrin IX monomethyl ester cyclase